MYQVFVKENKDLISFHVYHNFNDSLSNTLFPAALKYSNVKSTNKKDKNTDKTIYFPWLKSNLKVAILMKVAMYKPF